MKKIVAFVLVLTVITGMLVGCVPGGETTAPTTELLPYENHKGLRFLTDRYEEGIGCFTLFSESRIFAVTTETESIL